MVTIYILICPITNECRWVGKTIEPLKRRLSKHLKHGTSHYNPRKRQWLEHIGTPVIEAVEVVNKTEYVEAESWWIQYFKALGADLLNVREPVRYKGGQ